MKIEEFCCVVNCEIEIAYRPGAVGPWITSISRSGKSVSFKEQMGDGILSTCTGWGATPEESLIDFIRNCNASKYKWLIIDGCDGKQERQTFGIPKLER